MLNIFEDSLKRSAVQGKRIGPKKNLGFLSKAQLSLNLGALWALIGKFDLLSSNGIGTLWSGFGSLPEYLAVAFPVRQSVLVLAYEDWIV